jgi:hypothetical protein
MKIKNKKWSLRDKFLYGDIMHVALEYLTEVEKLSDFNRILSSKDAFNNFLLERLIFIYKPYISDAVYQKLKRLNIKRLYNFFRKYLDSGYIVKTENTMIVPDNKTGRFIFLRPDILFINKSDKKIVIVELKSGKRYDKKQLKEYKSAIRQNMKAWRVYGKLYLAGIDKLFNF